MTNGDEHSPLVGKRVLHVGCGGAPLPAWLADNVETRFDIDLIHNPDIVGDMRNAYEAVGDARFDIVFTNHALEHLYPHEIVPTLEGFRKILNDGGMAIVIVPNMKDIPPTDEVIYDSPSGPITGLDMYYGKASLIEKMPYMAHHTGFVKSTMEKAFTDAGFPKGAVHEDSSFNLIAIGTA